MNYLIVVIGGGVGALLRHLSTIFIQKTFETEVSVGILFVNVLGALLIGFLFNIFDDVPSELRLFLVTGFLGGYTTFSSYTMEPMRYLLNGNIKLAIVNILLNNVLCGLFFMAGMGISKIVIKH
jgi:CrcB protein